MPTLKSLMAFSVLFAASSVSYAQSPNLTESAKSLETTSRTFADDSIQPSDGSAAAVMFPISGVSTTLPVGAASALPAEAASIKTVAYPAAPVLATPTQVAAAAPALVVLPGHVPAIAKAGTFDHGRAPSSQQLDHLQMQLKRSPAKQAALATLLAAQADPKSASFHKFLSAAEFGQTYGASDAQLQQVEAWMQANGLIVESVNEARTAIQFSSSVGAVEGALHTELHNLSVKGVTHMAPTIEPSVPAALAGSLQGVALSDFQPHPLHVDVRSLKPNASTRKFTPVGEKSPGATASFAVDYLGDEYQIVSPADFAKIYNLTPAWTAGYRGKGQTIAVVEDSMMKAADATTFRKAFGLSSYAGTFTQLAPVGSHPCANPGVNADESEVALDAEWSGATAPDAAIVVAACENTRTEFGGLIALENLLSQAAPPPIVSMSYGYCEAEMGAIEINQFNAAYEQAVAEGVSVFVASGDSSSASCDADESYAAAGVQVSGFATTPYNVAVGGTDFYDLIQGSTSQYWSETNGANYSSALSYVPEKTWNDSCADSDVLNYTGYAVAYGSDGFCNSSNAYEFLTTTGGSGGPSAIFLKPSWQNVYGVPSDGVRDIPDISLFASNGFWSHLLIYCNSDPRSSGVPCSYTNSTDAIYNSAGGTSFAAPAMAGIFSLITQKYGPQGNPNTRLYAMAASEYGTQGSPLPSTLTSCNSTLGGSVDPTCTFYDVTQGSIDVPCAGANCFGWSTNSFGYIAEYGALSTSTATFASAFPTGSGWDFATGLGSINATNLLNNWSTTESALPVRPIAPPILRRPIARPEPIAPIMPGTMNAN